MSTFARTPEGSHENDAFDPALTEWFDERHRGREHSRRELEGLVRTLALRSDLWRPWVAHSAVIVRRPRVISGSQNASP